MAEVSGGTHGHADGSVHAHGAISEPAFVHSTNAGGSLTDVSIHLPSWSEVWQVLSFQGGYNTNIVIGSTALLGIAAGIVGTLALLRKRSLVADALSHATLPGLACAFIFATLLGMDGRSVPLLLLGAAVSGVLGILVTQWILRYTRLKEDAAIGLVLSVFFGAGTVLLSIIQQMPGAQAAGIDCFIFGQTAAVTSNDAWLMAGIAVLTITIAGLFLKECAMVCFNDAYAKVTGWPVSLIDLLMMILLVVVTVAGMQAVGLLLVVAMLIIPAVAARFWTERLWRLVAMSALIGGVSGYAGSVSSALLERMPAGAVIVLISGCCFVLSMLLAPQRGVCASLWRRFQLRLRIAVDHLLESAVEQQGVLAAKDYQALYRERSWSRLLRVAVAWRMWRQDLGQSEQGGWHVSDLGYRRGREVRRNHRLWHQYLLSHADVATQHIDWSVDQVEHILAPDVIAELEAATPDIETQAMIRGIA